MESLTTRMQVVEATITDMASKIDAYVKKMDGMMSTIEDNDARVKGSMEGNKGILEARMTEFQTTMSKAIVDAAGIQQAQLQVLSSEASTNIIGMDFKFKTVNDLITAAETAWIGSEQTQEDQMNRIIAIEQEVIRMATESTDFKKQAVSEITKVKMEMEQGDDSDKGEEKKDFYKPVTEYKSITDLPKLTNDKSGFRDWKIRMKNSLKQIF